MNTSKFLTLALLVASAALASLAAAPVSNVARADYLGDPYPLTTCATCSKALAAGAETVVLEEMKDRSLNGTQVKFCCVKCADDFKADPAKAVPAMQKAIIAAAPAGYPLKNCLMMREEALDDTAKKVVYQNRVYQVCCKKCVVRFEKDPAKNAKEWEALVVAAQKDAYPLKTCVVSGKAIEGAGVWVVVQKRAYHLCCPGCVAPLHADPAKYAAMLAPAKP